MRRIRVIFIILSIIYLVRQILEFERSLICSFSYQNFLRIGKDFNKSHAKFRLKRVESFPLEILFAEAEFEAYECTEVHTVYSC